MWARIGSLSILSKHLGNASQVWVVARPGWGQVWAVRARGGVGTHWQPLNTLKTPLPGVGSGEAGVGWGVVGTHWQPLNTQNT